MPHSSQSAAEEHSLPSAELNPLINPLLAENMGRWAEVYFTTPPESREQAVMELLHELQAAELMAWALLAFTDAPHEFRSGLLRIAGDEIRHMRLYREQIERLGHAVGDARAASRQSTVDSRQSAASAQLGA